MGEFRDISDLTLPELITEIELARRKVVEHLQFNLGPVAEKLADGRSTEVKTLQLSASQLESLYARWAECCASLESRIQTILTNEE